MDQFEDGTVSLEQGETGQASSSLPGPVLWRRSARASRVSLRIEARSGAVVITLPQRAGRQAGIALLTAHADWVREKLAALAPRIALEPGSEVPIGGALHVIRAVPGQAGETWLRPGAIIVGGACADVGGEGADVPARVAGFLRAEARRRIEVLVARHAEALGVAWRALRLKDTRTRWGSCAPDGTLAFSWRLVLAPGWVLDYVVAHEVAHLRELNHSPQFWDTVRLLTPNREAAVAWLRENGPALLRVG